MTTPKAKFEGLALTALREWRPLAEQGNALAQFNLGLMYMEGKGVPQDDAEAVKWYRKAAEQGVTEAQYNLGLMYDDGRGVGLRFGVALLMQAHMWFDLAASGYAPGEKRDIAVNNRDLVAKRMTPAQISEAEKLAREWRPNT